MSQLVYITQDQTSPTHQTQTKTLLVNLKPPKSSQHIWIHPHLSLTFDPIKGRGFRNTSDLTIPKGECLLVDCAYALIPVVDNPANNDKLCCSNPACNLPCQQGRCTCHNSCVDDVAWCSEACREADQIRHAFECTWLKRYASPIRAKWGEYTFGMVWLIVRLLANRHNQHSQGRNTLKKDGDGDGWTQIDSLCGSVHTWPHESVRLWSTLVKKYLQDSPILPHGLDRDKILHLICQEEANSFGLYPRETGILTPSHPHPSLQVELDRGEQFAAAVYPTAAIANHSCLPNVSGLPFPSLLFYPFK